MNSYKRVLILYGSQTFTAQEIAERIWRNTKILGFSGPVLAMDDYPIVDLRNEEFVIFVCATTGQGEVPDNMKKFWRFLLRRNLPLNCLEKLKFGVLALGDSSYSKFNFAGKMLHKRLLQLGAEPLLNIGLCDYQHDLGHDGVAIPWLKEYFNTLKSYFPDLIIGDLKTEFVPRWKVSLIKTQEEPQESCLENNIYYKTGCKDSFINPIHLEVDKNVRTTSESHFQDVRLITFKTLEQDKLDYNPGDIFNIRPKNSTEDVEELFSIFEAHGLDIKPHYKLQVEKHYDDMPVPEFLKTPLTLYDIAKEYWDLKAYPRQYFFSLLALVAEDKLEREKCIELGSPSGQEDWLNYSRRPKRTPLEVLRDFHRTASKLTVEVLFELFSTIKPRSFSIASSALLSDTRLDVLAAVVRYRTIIKKPRLGLASNWLKGLEPGDTVYGWIKKGSFKFPENNIPMIMVGPGTGLAPFRSVLQQRRCAGALDGRAHHLFFGCRSRRGDFHCRRELLEMVHEGQLTLYCAFSRDQDRKVYVQHKITEHGDALWKLIAERNAHIYVSGSATNMPDDVRDAFVEVCARGPADPGGFVQELQNTDRYQVEIW